ncbi:unnamed protein product [Somion occarium]|uniref:Pre-rRNA-processing protein PNO1 n=1 Tax=Somion occarium TaxID=3059160 RepID=A0ABP1DBB9_9APHY
MLSDITPPEAPNVFARNADFADRNFLTLPSPRFPATSKSPSSQKQVCIAMVAIHAEPSTSTTTHKKNRRKISKKNLKPAEPGQAREGDEDMHEEPISSEVAEAAQAAVLEEDNGNADDDELMIDSDPSSLPAQNAAPSFPPLPASAQRSTLKSETRRIPIPPHRMTPLKKDWVNIFGPLTEILGLQVRMNVQRKAVEIRTSKHTKEVGALQKGADFVKSFALGFDVNVCDSIFLPRLFHSVDMFVSRMRSLCCG